MDSIDSTMDSRIIVREYHFYISDDRSHDAHFVQHCFTLHDGFLRDGSGCDMAAMLGLV